MMSKNHNNLIWIDMEMSGLNSQTDKILEIAIIITDPFLTILEEGPVLVLKQSDEVLARMDAWNQSTHGKSGLIEKVKNSSTTEEVATHQLIEFIAKFVGKNRSPMCGNSICQDRRFMARHLPDLEAFFHYRNLDVSSLKILASRWRPDLSGLKKRNVHLALDDIRESIEELRYYRDNFLQVPSL